MPQVHVNGTGLEYSSQQMAKRSQSPRIKPVEGEEVKKGKKVFSGIQISE
jgi:hypothetical protein